MLNHCSNSHFNYCSTYGTMRRVDHQRCQASMRLFGSFSTLHGHGPAKFSQIPRPSTVVKDCGAGFYSAQGHMAAQNMPTTYNPLPKKAFLIRNS